VIVAVLDATNLERNLYLLAQITELRMPMVVAPQHGGRRRDPRLARGPEGLEHALGVPVVATVASEKAGIIELKQALSRATLSAPPHTAPMPGPIEAAIKQYLLRPRERISAAPPAPPARRP